MNKLRLGLPGMGNIGRHHAGCLLDGKTARGRLTAVASTSRCGGLHGGALVHSLPA
jgi:predicted dehydrogenase